MTEILTNAEDLISRVNQANPRDRDIILTKIFEAGKKIQDQSDEMKDQLVRIGQELSDARAIITELRSEITNHQLSADQALRNSAVVEYKLVEAEKALKSLRSENIEVSANLAPRSELYRIDEKFTGDDRTLYPAFQKQIRIALAQNADRYVTLQSQITLIYQNLGIGPKSFLDRYLQVDGH